MVLDYTSADVVAYSRSVDALCKSVHKTVQLNTKIKTWSDIVLIYKKAQQISMLANNDKCLFYSE